MFSSFLKRAPVVSIVSRRVCSLQTPVPRRSFVESAIMSGAPPTAYPTEIPEQDQTGGPGLDSKMKPAAHWTQLEFWDNEGKPYLKEYEGRGLLKDKAALITGGDSGIGRSVAILMAREGADISFVYLEEEEEDAQATKKEIEKAGRKANLLPSNVRDSDKCKKAVEDHMKAFGRLDVLVNNSTFSTHNCCMSRLTFPSLQVQCKRCVMTLKTSTSTLSRRPSVPTSSPCLLCASTPSHT